MTTTPQTNATLEQIAHIILEHDSFAICGHVSPDGDCLGSQLALWHALRSLGKQATCLLVRDEPIARSLSFMPGIDQMIPASAYAGEPEVFVGVDVPSRERIGEDACAVLDGCSTSITLDHHAYDMAMCQHVYVDPDSASASMIIWELVKTLCDEPPVESALCAYTGIVTDTGGFRFQNSDESAFIVAGELVGFGVDPAFVATNVFQSRTLASVKLEAVMLDRIQLNTEHRYAISYIVEKDYEETGASKSDAEPLIDTLRSICDLRVACMLREQDGVVRGSLRAKDETDVASLARELGGGGHKAAAGLTLHMTIEEAIELMHAKITGLLG